MQNNQVLDNPQANPIETGWLVGMIEAEGSFCMSMGNHRRQIQARVTWTNTDSGVISRFQAALDALGVHYYVQTGIRAGSHLGKKVRTDVHIYRYASVDKLMKTILPLLSPGTKKDCAQCVAEFVRSRIAQLPDSNHDGKHHARKMNNQERAYTSEQWAIVSRFQSIRESLREQRPCSGLDESR